MRGTRTDRDRTITWVVDATPPYCFVTHPGVMEDFAATLAVLEAPWSAADISSDDIIPDNRCFFGESRSPAVLAGLFVDDESLEKGWEYRSIPHERYGEVLTRLRTAGIPLVERPGAMFDLVASVHGGDLR